MGDIKNPPADETNPYNAVDIYQKTKAEGEEVALSYHGNDGLSVTVVRPAVIYGPGDMRMLKLFRYIVNGKFKMIGDGKTLTHPVYVDDLLDGMILAYESEKSAGRTYILGGEKYVTLNEWTKIIAQEAGAEISSIHVPLPPPLARLIFVRTSLRAVWYRTTALPQTGRLFCERPRLYHRPSKRRVGLPTQSRPHRRSEKNIGVV